GADQVSSGSSSGSSAGVPTLAPLVEPRAGSRGSTRATYRPLPGNGVPPRAATVTVRASGSHRGRSGSIRPDASSVTAPLASETTPSELAAHGPRPSVARNATLAPSGATAGWKTFPVGLAIGVVAPVSTSIRQSAIRPPRSLANTTER